MSYNHCQNIRQLLADFCCLMSSHKTQNVNMELLVPCFIKWLGGTASRIRLTQIRRVLETFSDSLVRSLSTTPCTITLQTFA